MNWEDHYRNEIHQAENARKSGNEGMARVCARRAVGILLGEFFSQQGIASPGPSAYDRIRLFQTISTLRPPLHEYPAHFLLRVSREHTLPDHIDLIAEAKQLRQELFE